MASLSPIAELDNSNGAHEERFTSPDNVGPAADNTVQNEAPARRLALQIMDPDYDGPLATDRAPEDGGNDQDEAESAGEEVGSDEKVDEVDEVEDADEGQNEENVDEGQEEQQQEEAEQQERDDGEDQDEQKQEDFDDESADPSIIAADLDRVFSNDSTLLLNNPLFGNVKIDSTPLDTWEDFLRLATRRTVEEIVTSYNAANPNTPVINKKISYRLGGCKAEVARRRGIERKDVVLAFERAKKTYGNIQHRKDMLAGARRAAKNATKGAKAVKGKGEASSEKVVSDEEEEKLEEDGGHETEESEEPKKSTSRGKKRACSAAKDSEDVEGKSSPKKRRRSSRKSKADEED